MKRSVVSTDIDAGQAEGGRNGYTSYSDLGLGSTFVWDNKFIRRLHGNLASTECEKPGRKF